MGAKASVAEKVDNGMLGHFSESISPSSGPTSLSSQAGRCIEHRCQKTPSAVAQDDDFLLDEIPMLLQRPPFLATDDLEDSNLESTCGRETFSTISSFRSPSSLLATGPRSSICSNGRLRVDDLEVSLCSTWSDEMPHDTGSDQELERCMALRRPKFSWSRCMALVKEL